MNRIRSLFSVLVIVCCWATAAIPAAAQDQEKKGPALVDGRAKAEVVERIGRLLADNYIFPEKAGEMKSLLDRKLNDGGYDSITLAAVLARTLTRDLQSVSGDRHLRVVYDPDQVGSIRASHSRSPEEREKQRLEILENERLANYGFQRLEILEGNIGYLDLRFFSGFRQAGETAAAAMAFLSSADAVIIDLRQNGGGHPEMIQIICSYFLDGNTHLNSFEYRGQEVMRQFWTLPYTPGPTMFSIPLYILTSRRTFSAAEEFCYDLKCLKRATLVGETTGGGAHPGGFHIVNDDFLIWVSSGRAVNPVTKTNWEGTGIEPDVAVGQEKALDKARALALEKLMAEADSADRKALLQWALDGLTAEISPASVDEAVLRRYVGRFQQGRTLFKDGRLWAVTGGREFPLIPVSESYFIIDGVPNVRIEFVLSDDGKGLNMISRFRDGRQETTPLERD